MLISCRVRVIPHTVEQNVAIDDRFLSCRVRVIPHTVERSEGDATKYFGCRVRVIPHTVEPKKEVCPPVPVVECG